jgi:C4-dicarboxylate-specific signal transduction histidine kinase
MMAAARRHNHCQLQADLPMIEADRVQIQQLLINLVHNAMEAMLGVTDRAIESGQSRTRTPG